MMTSAIFLGAILGAGAQLIFPNGFQGVAKFTSAIMVRHVPNDTDIRISFQDNNTAFFDSAASTLYVREQAKMSSWLVNSNSTLSTCTYTCDAGACGQGCSCGAESLFGAWQHAAPLARMRIGSKCGRGRIGLWWTFDDVANGRQVQFCAEHKTGFPIVMRILVTKSYVAQFEFSSFQIRKQPSSLFSRRQPARVCRRTRVVSGRMRSNTPMPRVCRRACICGTRPSEYCTRS
jgi:hypothetical protein